MERLHIRPPGSELKSTCGQPLTKDEHGSLYMYEKDHLEQAIRSGLKPVAYFRDQACPECWRLAGLPE